MYLFNHEAYDWALVKSWFDPWLCDACLSGEEKQFADTWHTAGHETIERLGSRWNRVTGPDDVGPQSLLSQIHSRRHLKTSVSCLCVCVCIVRHAPRQVRKWSDRMGGWGGGGDLAYLEFFALPSHLWCPLLTVGGGGGSRGLFGAGWWKSSISVWWGGGGGWNWRWNGYESNLAINPAL